VTDIDEHTFQLQAGGSGVSHGGRLWAVIAGVAALTAVFLGVFRLMNKPRSGIEPSTIQCAKQATALVEIDEEGDVTWGTAFCIDPNGIFVTSEHVTAVSEGRNVKLILYPGERNQQIVSADVLRLDKDADLAVLKAATTNAVTALELGSGDGLMETLRVVAFGYPFGRILAIGEEEYPSISVNTGAITSLRKKDGVLELIQLDAALNPGNSGGPVIDEAGRVIGIVAASIRGADINLAIPVSRLTALLAKRELLLTPEVIPAGHEYRECEFTVHVVSVGKPAEQETVEVVLSTGNGDQRSFTAQPVGDNKFMVRAVPAPGPKRDSLLRVMLKFATGTVVGLVEDREIKVGGESVRLSRVRQVESGPETTVTLIDGRQLTGPIQGAEALEASLGKLSTTIDLTEAASVTVTPTGASVGAVNYRVVLKQGGKRVAEKSGALPVGNPLAAVSPDPPAASTATTPGENPGVTELTLPGAVADVAAGGGGRYLVLYLKKLQKLAVFDVQSAKVARFISVPAEDLLLAANKDAVIVGLLTQKLLVRYNLNSGEREAMVTSPVEDLRSLAMGYASNGPLLVNDRTFLSPVTMKVIALRKKPHHYQCPGERAVIRAGGDGDTFGAWRRGISPTGLFLGTFNGANLQWRAEHKSVGHVIPSFDGSAIFTRYGMYTPELKRVGSERDHPACIPAYDNTYYLAFTRVKSSRGYQRRFEGALFTVCDQRALLTLPQMDELTEEVFDEGGYSRMTLEKRIHFFPEANLLVTVPISPSRLVLRKLSVTRALEKSGIDYLFVNSIPPRSAKRGGTYEYQVEVQSKKGGLRYTLASAPAGMTVSQTGKLQWEVPKKVPENPVIVIMTVGDATGQEVYHTFKIKLH
jgi:serine protease Do